MLKFTENIDLAVNSFTDIIQLMAWLSTLVLNHHFLNHIF